MEDTMAKNHNQRGFGRGYKRSEQKKLTAKMIPEEIKVGHQIKADFWDDDDFYENWVRYLSEISKKEKRCTEDDFAWNFILEPLW